MKAFRLRQVIAKRQIDLLGETGAICGKVLISFSKPRRAQDPHVYSCLFQITGIKSGGVFRTYGVDAVQALLLAQVKAGTKLYTSEEFKGGFLRLNGDKNLDLPAVSEVFGSHIHNPTLNLLV